VYFVIRLNDIPSRKQTFALSAMWARLLWQNVHARST
jgi:hypothetical protein